MAHHTKSSTRILHCHEYSEIKVFFSIEVALLRRTLLLVSPRRVRKCAFIVCCGVVCVVCTYQLQTELYIYIYVCVCVCVCQYKHSYCTHFNMVTIEGIMKVKKENVHKLWNFHSE